MSGMVQADLFAQKEALPASMQKGAPRRSCGPKKAAIRSEVARLDCPLIGCGGSSTQQRSRDGLPFLLQRGGGQWAAGAAIPAAGIRQIAFDTVQIGMRPGAFGVGLLLYALMRQVPIALGFPPQRLRSHAKPVGWGSVCKRGFVSRKIHFLFSSSNCL